MLSIGSSFLSLPGSPGRPLSFCFDGSLPAIRAKTRISTGRRHGAIWRGGPRPGTSAGTARDTRSAICAEPAKRTFFGGSDAPSTRITSSQGRRTHGWRSIPTTARSSAICTIPEKGRGGAPTGGDCASGISASLFRFCGFSFGWCGGFERSALQIILDDVTHQPRHASFAAFRERLELFKVFFIQTHRSGLFCH